MNKVALKIAASPMILGLTMVGCSTNPAMVSRTTLSSPGAVKPASASRHHDDARQATQKGNFAGALDAAEKAVEFSPRDSGYRMVLGDLYLKNGRFLSAEAAFSDVLTLDSGNSRALFSLALAQIALGKRHIALTHLDRLAETAAPGDVGLAYALAGQPHRAVEMLEPAARAADADGRVRQNLALAYALTGDWQKARITASQDLSPADLTTRMEEWARFAQPATQADQVASLIGATPAEDLGQPVRLALAPAESKPVAYAEAQPAPEVPVEQAPVQVAAAELPASTIEPPVEQAVYAEAARALIAPQPAIVHASASMVAVPVPTFSPAPRTERAVVRTAGHSRFVVQLGAFSNAAGVERAWAQAQKRYGFGGDRAPLSATVTLPGKGIVHRLSVAGFSSQSDAARVCRSIKGKGGNCFVRNNAGDAPVRWASRDNRAG